jgi:hypothetical protein
MKLNKNQVKFIQFDEFLKININNLTKKGERYGKED